MSHGRELQAPARVFCFPHGGGDPRAYADWQPSMGDDADILAVRVPGRGSRGDERPPASIAELAGAAAAEIAAAADRPTYLFGHSLGALVAFEAARRLRQAPMVRHLVASGCAAPSLLPTDYLRWAAELDDRAFAEAMAKFEGMSPEIVEDRELQELLLPDLRADCRLIAEYRHQPAAPLAIGLTLINGRDDWRVGNAMLEPWRREVTTVPDDHWRDGGHFYFADRPDAVVNLLRAMVRAGASDPAPADEHVEVI
ncbi:MAG: alpha/beta fold hydrolase [Micromonosporaceae bacterium]|nr:alpha/beta fold hydrolase [Micromonosporaceae bacterium]